MNIPAVVLTPNIANINAPVSVVIGIATVKHGSVVNLQQEKKCRPLKAPYLSAMAFGKVRPSTVAAFMAVS